MDTILNRIEKIAQNEGVKITTLERIIGASKGVLSRAINNGTDIQSKWIQSIVENYPLYSERWLLTGDGDMLKSSKEEINIIHNPVYSENKYNNEVPLYDVSAAANLQTLFSNKDQHILGKIVIPDSPRCDGAIYVSGDSMYPLLKSGDIIAYKQTQSFIYLVYGEMYLVSYELDGDEFLTVKYVNKSDLKEHIKLVSYNTHHQPMDIPISAINALALVKFSIRKNTMR